MPEGILSPQPWLFVQILHAQAVTDRPSFPNTKEKNILYT